jgi:thioredoxin-related protein
MTFLKTIVAAASFAIVSPLPSAALELVMVEQHGCVYCARWNEDIGPIYPKTEQGRAAPLRRVDLHDLPREMTFASPPVFTPTFVLMNEDTELARMEGYAGDEFFWVLLEQLIATHSPKASQPGNQPKP